MYNNKIGCKVALFWLAWAFVAEKNGNLKLADQIYNKGLRRFAEPKDLLQKRYHQFQRRLARKCISDDPNSIEIIEEKPMHTNKSSSFIKSKSASIKNDKNLQTQFSIFEEPKLNGNFAIFDENNDENNDEKSHWKILGSENERHKENKGLISKWTESTIYDNTKNAVPSIPKIEIFQDEEFIDSSFNKSVYPVIETLNKSSNVNRENRKG